MNLRLVSPEDPFLRKPCRSCQRSQAWIDKHVVPFLAPMQQIMRTNGGVGLAAPQVGISFRFFLMLYQGRMSVALNPEVASAFGPKVARVEGCLSFPGRSTLVERKEHILARWTDTRGDIRTLEMKGEDARVFQHETDHLNGILIFS